MASLQWLKVILESSVVGVIIGGAITFLTQWLIDKSRSKRDKKQGIASVQSEIDQIVQMMDGEAWKHYLYYLPTDQWTKNQQYFLPAKTDFTKKVSDGYKAALAYNKVLMAREAHADIRKDIARYSEAASDAFRAAQKMLPSL